MSLQQRRERERQDRRESILDAAERTFFEKGYERTSMDEIAKAAQLSRALLYVYFKDKSAILRSITLRAGEELRRRFQAAVATEATGIGQIAAIGQAYYQFSQQKPDYFDVLTHAASLSIDNADELGQAQRECEFRTMEVLVAALTTGLEDNTLSGRRIVEPLETALYLWGALHGVIMLSKQQGRGSHTAAAVRPEKLVAHTMQMLMLSLQEPRGN
ncbi:TetR/AcrR family transcriptional regulator [Hydrocarboniclastica marina]|uniref:TetR/AcrR family transcriptional regulator n=1 Tax=Hydrocarboniclastica marina TaxID=2259620 RepID=A0A4P7XLM6_9ALTE|nr:TetR/AcrR family transcriptional regulator [Hydrocarboniclastica marina]MAL99184.1 TetR family transcriptional regulator [Alteromonadaceae bacterium]QCF26867.1 TetR/AcrR family transcriptional regulator [Hydrocarboniclastica marina]